MPDQRAGDYLTDYLFRNFQFCLEPHLQWKLTDIRTGIELSSGAPQVIMSDGQRKINLVGQEEWGGGKATQAEAAGLEEQAGILTRKVLINGVALTVEFAFLQHTPLFLLRLHLINQKDQDIHCAWLNLISPIANANLLFPTEQPRLACYSNGWQSWSYSGTYQARQKQRISGLANLQRAMWHNSKTPFPNRKGQFTSDLFTVVIEQSSRNGLLSGFLSQKQQFGHAEVDLRSDPNLWLKASANDVTLPPGGELWTDWAAIQVVDFDQPDPLQAYLQAAAKANHVRIQQGIPVGWCSWYHYFTKITPANLIANIRLLREMKSELPIGLVQIDDGFEQAVGDWLDFKSEFPNGLEPVTREIRESGFTPGLWLAPFIVHPSSNRYKFHREMLLKTQTGQLADAGWNWNGFNTGLDMTHPGAQEYVHQVIDTAVHQWGFPYLKLDFLYAGCLPGKYTDPTLTRAQVYDRAMRLIRETAGEGTFLLGCGAPIGGSIGHVDAMRIGSDVAPDWKPKYKGVELLFPREPNIPSVANSLQNTVSRAWLHNRWWLNDPDCLLLRSTTKLTEAEVLTQASLTALSGGMLLFSDDMAQVPPDRLKIAQVLIPVIGKTPQVIDWHEKTTPSKLRVDLEGAVGTWHLLSFTNWSDRPVNPSLKVADYHLDPKVTWLMRSFWDGQVSSIQDGIIEPGTLRPHGTWLAAVRKLGGDAPRYAGSSLHISQGMEVAHWEVSHHHRVELILRLPRKAEGEIYLYIPAQEVKVKSDGKETLITGSRNVFKIPIAFKEEYRIVIR